MLYYESQTHKSSRQAEAKLQLKSLRSEPKLGLHNSWVENLKFIPVHMKVIHISHRDRVADL